MTAVTATPNTNPPMKMTDGPTTTIRISKQSAQTGTTGTIGRVTCDCSFLCYKYSTYRAKVKRKPVEWTILINGVLTINGVMRATSPASLRHFYPAHAPLSPPVALGGIPAASAASAPPWWYPGRWPRMASLVASWWPPGSIPVQGRGDRLTPLAASCGVLVASCPLVPVSWRFGSTRRP
jgi:hypothetical protein